MTIKQAIEIVELHNKWRRDNDNKFKMVNPKELGIALDTLVAVAKDFCIGLKSQRDEYNRT